MHVSAGLVVLDNRKERVELETIVGTRMPKPPTAEAVDNWLQQALAESERYPDNPGHRARIQLLQIASARLAIARRDDARSTAPTTPRASQPASYDITERLAEKIAIGDANQLAGLFSAALEIRKLNPEASNNVLFALADAGYSNAHYTLYESYLEGSNGVPLDLGKALDHLRAAANAGLVVAMKTLGGWYHQGDKYKRSGTKLVDVDLNAAKEWYRKAVEAGDSWSAESLAEVVLNGRQSAKQCSPEELAEIEKCYVHAGQYFTLGNLYCREDQAGHCSEKDLEAAKRWYVKGRATGIARFQCEECAAILKAWGEPDIIKESKTSVSNLEFVAAVIGFVFWAIVGTLLLGLVLQVSAFTIPLLLAGLLASFVGKVVWRMWKSR